MHLVHQQVMQQASKCWVLVVISPGSFVAHSWLFRVGKEMEGKMNKLNVRWLPETFAIVSLTISKTPLTEVCVAPFNESPSRVHTHAPGKLIVVSDGRELRAHVATRQ